ncbi:Cytochrome P450 9e2 [Melipona quadrifasciata]|uniref:Cytochrome P450 9e2 n=1 Tax=Melipona quadrifasciata TaxID=166423 RepID=A0A0M8ZYC9_9HYME|nr:Cytochrome P450 9e2 [Melipona quadrifasciata]
MSSAFFALLVGAFSLLCFYLYLKHNYWKRNGIPTVRGCVPLVGHLLPTITKRMNFIEFIRLAYEEHKDHSMVGMYKGTRPVLIVRDPSLVKIVMQSNFSNFHENGIKVVPEADPLLSKNPFFCYGETWSTGRKRLTYAFSNVRLKTLFAAVSGVCKKFEKFLNEQLKTSNKYEVDLKSLSLRFTGEVVANAGLGIEGYCFEEGPGGSTFYNLVGNTTAESLGTIILFHYPSINRLLKLSFLPKSVDELFRNVVSENLKIRRNESTPRNDFLQLMIDMEKTGEVIDEESVSAHAVSLYLDGTETSSITLNFIGHNLATNPEIQEKLRKEVRSTIEKHGGLTFEALKDMTYMNQVISESQRLYSPVGFLQKKCTEEFELQGSDGLTYRIKPGTELVISVSGLHGDPRYWDNPDVFDPERFNDERKQTIEKMTYLPFGEGPRICVGMRMALLQIKAGLATLMNNYKLELSPRTQLPLKLSPHYFMSEPVGGNWVYISKL